ncbi:tetratricopeptide repeat protein [Candidatus Poribacteria bacterium]|nr:tetratricopeptide repeat protein [Candidatus Poribacteria bacterium]
MVRVTKNQLKEDKLISTTARISAFISENWQKIIAVIAGVIVIIAAIALYSNYITGKNEKAARLLTEAREIYSNAETALSEDGITESTKEEFEEARIKLQEIPKVGGHDHTITEALFYSAKSSYYLGRYNEAISDFQKIVKKYSDSVFAPYSQRAIGQCYEQLDGSDNLRKAIQQYEKLSRNPESYINLLAYIDKGRCYENLGEWDKALESYKFIADRFKWNVESAIQAKAMSSVQKAKDVISKYESVAGKNSSYDNLIKLAGQKESQKQWLEALEIYDRIIYSQKENWSQQNASEAARALQEYEKLSSTIINNIRTGKKYQEEGNWESALRYYQRSVDFDFIPGTDLYEKSQSRIDWINSVEKS